MDILFAALEFEISGILKICRARKIYRKRQLRLYEGRFKERLFVFAIMGMGRENACFAFETVYCKYLQSEKAGKRAYLFGFCGISDLLEIGDIVLYCSLSCQEDGTIKRIEISHPARIVSLIQDNADRIGIRVHHLDAEAVSKVLSARHHQRKGFLQRKIPAFDMESFSLAKAANDASVELIIIRSISDNNEQPIPESIANLGSKKTIISFLGLAGNLFCSRKNLLLFFQTLKNFKKARESLLLSFKALFDDNQRNERTPYPG